jgi:hypothetical protein
LEHEASGGQCEHDAAEGYGYSEGPLMAGLEASFGYPRRLKKSSCWGSTQNSSPSSFSIIILDSTPSCAIHSSSEVASTTRPVLKYVPFRRTSTVAPRRSDQSWRRCGCVVRAMKILWSTLAVHAVGCPATAGGISCGGTADSWLQEPKSGLVCCAAGCVLASRIGITTRKRLLCGSPGKRR